MKKSVAIFDVDKTLIKGDSMFYMLWFGMKKRPYLIAYIPVIVFKVALYFIGVIDIKKAKEALYIPLKYLEREEIEEFYYKVLIKKLYPNIMKVLEKHKEEERHILLISASPQIYLEYFKKEVGVNEVIGTELIELEGKTLNIIKGENCKSLEKVKRINKYLKENNLEIDFDKSFAYSDSSSDMPMLSLVKNRYRVTRGMVQEAIW